MLIHFYLYFETDKVFDQDLLYIVKPKKNTTLIQDILLISPLTTWT